MTMHKSTPKSPWPGPTAGTIGTYEQQLPRAVEKKVDGKLLETKQPSVSLRCYLLVPHPKLKFSQIPPCGPFLVRGHGACSGTRAGKDARCDIGPGSRASQHCLALKTCVCCSRGRRLGKVENSLWR